MTGIRFLHGRWQQVLKHGRREPLADLRVLDVRYRILPALFRFFRPPHAVTRDERRGKTATSHLHEPATTVTSRHGIRLAVNFSGTNRSWNLTQMIRSNQTSRSTRPWTPDRQTVRAAAQTRPADPVNRTRSRLSPQIVDREMERLAITAVLFFLCSASLGFLFPRLFPSKLGVGRWLFDVLPPAAPLASIIPRPLHPHRLFLFDIGRLDFRRLWGPQKVGFPRILCVEEQLAALDKEVPVCGLLSSTSL